MCATLRSVDRLQRVLTDNFLQRYVTDLSVNDFVSQGVKVKDGSKRSVGCAHGEKRQNFIHTKIGPYADIMVIGIDEGILAGWVYPEDMMDAGDRFLIRVNSLNKMPQKFDFALQCPHLSVFGGWFDNNEGAWRCFGCEQTVGV